MVDVLVLVNLKFWFVVQVLLIGQEENSGENRFNLYLWATRKYLAANFKLWQAPTCNSVPGSAPGERAWGGGRGGFCWACLFFLSTSNFGLDKKGSLRLYTPQIALKLMRTE